jgi:hypothetical protein
VLLFVFAFMVRQLFTRNLLSFTRQARKIYRQDQRVTLGISASQLCSAAGTYHCSLSDPDGTFS